MIIILYSLLLCQDRRLFMNWNNLGIRISVIRLFIFIRIFIIPIRTFINQSQIIVLNNILFYYHGCAFMLNPNGREDFSL